jgi:hypothetical protein
MAVHVGIHLEKETTDKSANALLEGSYGGHRKSRVGGYELEPTWRSASALTVVIQSSQESKQSPQERSHALASPEDQHPISWEIAIPRAPQCATVLEIAHDIPNIQMRIDAVCECFKGYGRAAQRQGPWLTARIEIGGIRKPQGHDVPRVERVTKIGPAHPRYRNSATRLRRLALDSARVTTTSGEHADEAVDRVTRPGFERRDTGSRRSHWPTSPRVDTTDHGFLRRMRRLGEVMC